MIVLAVLFVIAQNWEKIKVSYNKEMVKKLWYSLPMGCYSAIKRNELSIHKIT